MTPNGPFERDRTRAAGRAISVVAIAGTAIATLIPTSQTITWGPWCIACGSLSSVDLILNVILFIPLGVGLVMAGVRPAMAVVAGFAFSLTIESLQVAVVAGRDASVGDLMMNTLGGALGAVAGRHTGALLAPARTLALRLVTGWAALLAGSHAVATYALVPSPTSLPYHGQIGRALGDRPPYPGTVVSVTVGGHRIPDSYFDSRQVYPELTRPDGAPVSVVVVPAGQPPWVASIARIVDVRRTENLQMAQRGHSAVFVVRTNASALRLRPVRARLAGVFPATAGQADTIRLAGQYGRRSISLSAQGRGEERRVRVRLTPGHTWRLLSPFTMDASGNAGDVTLGALWMLALFAPMGYWAAFTRVKVGASTGGVPPAAGVAVAAAAVAVTVLLPVAFGTHVAVWTEWLGIAGGIAGGSVGGRFVARRVDRPR